MQSGHGRSELVIATYADTMTSAPIYGCAALFIAMAGVSAVFSFEPLGRGARRGALVVVSGWVRYTDMVGKEGTEIGNRATGHRPRP